MDVKRTVIGIIIAVVIILGIQKCNNDKYQMLKGEYGILEEQYNTQKKELETISEKRQKEKDSLNFIISQREVTNNLLTKENTSLRDKISAIKDRPFSVPKNLEGLVLYFNERYQTKENIIVEDKVGLGLFTAMDISSELEEGDKAIEIIPLQVEVIKNQDTIIDNLNKDKKDLNVLIASAEDEIQKRKKLQEAGEKSVENLEKQVKKANNKNFWNKILIGVGTISGFLIGKNL